MKSHFIPFSLCLILGVWASSGAGGRLRADPGTSYTHFYAAPASGTAGNGVLSVDVHFYLWIPKVRTLRGVIVHQHGCGNGAELGGVTAAQDLHWRALAEKWNCALLGSSYRAGDGRDCALWCDPRNGSDAAFQRALADLADESGHAELTRVPWCLWGHSGGGIWSNLMLLLHPDRVVAAWLRSGTVSGAPVERWHPPERTPAALQVPVMANPGEKEKNHERFHGAWAGSMRMMEDWNAQAGWVGVAVDPKTAHECGDSRYLAIRFFDACLKQRLPSKLGSPLRRMNSSIGRLGNAQTREISRMPPSGAAIPHLSRLPDAEFARAWSEFIEFGYIRDRTAPSPPERVRVERSPTGGMELRWSAVADLESGLGGFEIERNGVVSATLPQKPNSKYGRPLIQGMTYHDTPADPVTEFHWPISDEDARSARFRIRSLNTSGLRSRPVLVTGL